MRFDDPRILGIFIGLILGLQYAATLSSFLPMFMVLAIFYLLRTQRVTR